ncbi:MAG TPA: pantoate--beta-alanine ligase [Chthoniobacterales bacterium]
MELIATPVDLHRAARQLPRPLALVPTMGALHAGHLALVARAQELAAGGTVAASIFVNPAQFRPGEDLGRYPRPFAQDRRLLEAAGCHLLFAPTAESMYAADTSVTIRENSLSQTMCGLARPGHFDGVCLVVAKLFHLFQPDFALFGQKDFQQLTIVRRMVRDLNFGVQIVPVPTVREPDGLAMSSRNAYLSKEERREAPILYRTLRGAADKCLQGGITRSELEGWMSAEIGQARSSRVDYAVAVHPETLQPKTDLVPPMLLAAAVFFGTTRLLDNYLLDHANGTL